MRAALVLAMWTLGCGGAVPAPPTAPPPAPARVAPAVPAETKTEEPVGAVPLPEARRARPPLDEIDTTVRLEDLPTAGATWPMRVGVGHAGRVLIALHLVGFELELAVVETEPDPEGGYPGALESFRMGTAVRAPNTNLGAFTPVHRLHPDTGAEHAPLKFAVRLLPHERAPAATRRQWAVYTTDGAVFVADKLVTAAAWTPRLRVDMPRASEIVAVHPGWH